MITPRENLLRVLRHEMPDWIPIVGHVDNYNQPSREGLPAPLADALEGKPDWGPTGIIDFCRYLGLDILERTGAPVRSDNPAVECETRWEGELLHTHWRTEAGELHEVRRRASAESPFYTVKHALGTPADLAPLACVFEGEEFRIDDEATAAFEERKRLVGDGGVVTVGVPATPLGNLVRIYAGPQNVAYLDADAPSGLRDLLAAMEDNYLRHLELCATCGADAVISYDDTSTSTISPRMFGELEVPYINRAAAICHRHGVRYIHHSCGLLRGLLDLYAQTAMDAVDALCVEPIGDVTMAQAREALGRGITILASVVQLCLSFDDTDAVAQHLRDMLRQAAPGDNLVLVAFADPLKTMEQTQWLVEQARQYAEECVAG